jgi:hypothetical protein
MKKVFLLFAVFVCTTLSAQMEIKSGLILGSGMGSLGNTQFKSVQEINEIRYKNPDALIGYKFRLLPSQKRYFYDVDITAGLKRFVHWQNPNYVISPDNFEMPAPIFDHDYTYFQFSLSPSWNYRFFDKFYAGVGLSPTLYMVKGKKQNDNRITGYKFDIPATIKIGYDFKYLDVSLGYSHGFFNTAYSDYITKSSFRNWQIQVFIPF